MDDLQNVKAIRKNILLGAYAAGIGHIASSMSLAEVLYVLYCKDILKHRPKDPTWEGRDRLILSKGHGSLALYSVLAEAGYFPKEELLSFGKVDSRLGGEPVLGTLPGIEASTGSLGHGLSIGLGMALSMKLDSKPNRVFVVLGDGECQEGSVWEAILMAPALKLDNLIIVIDNNRIQKMGRTEVISGEADWDARLRAFGWDVCQVDGHDVSALTACFAGLTPQGRPMAVIAHTQKGRGLSFMEDKVEWHYRLPGKKDMRKAAEELGITQEELDYAKNTRQ